MKVVVVRWHDAHADTHGWVDPDAKGDTDPLAVCSFGLRLKTGRGGKKGHVSIAQSMTADGMLDSILHIPRKMVREVVVIGDVDATGERTSYKARGRVSGRLSTASRGTRPR